MKERWCVGAEKGQDTQSYLLGYRSKTQGIPGKDFDLVVSLGSREGKALEEGMLLHPI